MSIGPGSTNGACALFALAAHSRQQPFSLATTRLYAHVVSMAYLTAVTGAPDRSITPCTAWGKRLALRITWRHATADRRPARIGGMSTTSRCRQYRTVQTVEVARWHSCAGDELPHSFCLGLLLPVPNDHRLAAIQGRCRARSIGNPAALRPRLAADRALPGGSERNRPDRPF